MNGNGGIINSALYDDAAVGPGGGGLPGTLDYYVRYGYWYPTGHTGAINPASADAAGDMPININGGGGVQPGMYPIVYDEPKGQMGLLILAAIVLLGVMK